MGPKGPKCWPQASAGDYKGAQLPYLAEKREGALSASHINKTFRDHTDHPVLADDVYKQFWNIDFLKFSAILPKKILTLPKPRTDSVFEDEI